MIANPHCKYTDKYATLPICIFEVAHVPVQISTVYVALDDAVTQLLIPFAFISF